MKCLRNTHKRNQVTLIPVLLVLTVMVTVLSGCDNSRPQVADLVLRNGKVVTLEDGAAEAQAIAVIDGKVAAVGDDAAMSKWVGDETEVIDLAGRLAVPGFIEGHGHFMSLGRSRLELDLAAPTSWDEIVALVADSVAAADPGDWIMGRGWHQDKWTSTPMPNVEGFPVGLKLSAVSPNNPVVLSHASGHASFVNQAALTVAGIDRNTPDPPGGEILRDASGRPIGLLRETAQSLVSLEYERSVSAADRRRTNLQTASLASREVIAKGITTFQDAGVGVETIDLYKELLDSGDIQVRLWVMIQGRTDNLESKLAEYRTIGYASDHLTVRAIKLSMDGALGSRGAWMLEPYSDAPQLTGLNLIPVDYVASTAELAKKYNYQLCVHAIGDRANREVLNVFESAFDGTEQDQRWRIEHAQHLNPADIPRFAELGVIASMQAVHCTSDGPWVPVRIGDKRAQEGAYVWRKLIDSGATVTNGTDTPVEDVDPLASYYSSVTRMMNNGERFYPDQRMTRIEGLKAYTINNAYSGFQEDSRGSLAPGKLADIVVLSNDILTVPESELLNTRVDYTIIGGNVVYKRSE